MVSDFFSKVNHVIGIGFSGYRLGFSRIQLDLGFLKSGIGLKLERFFGYDLHTYCYVLDLLVLTLDIGLVSGYWILKPLLKTYYYWII
jgi:hypothetical protein